jgi:hypothetical protein
MHGTPTRPAPHNSFAEAVACSEAINRWCGPTDAPHSVRGRVWVARPAPSKKEKNRPPTHASCFDYTNGKWVKASQITMASPDYEFLAREVKTLTELVTTIDRRLVEVEKVNARLEVAALSTGRAMAEISRHWDGVYEAMRRDQPPSSS